MFSKAISEFAGRIAATDLNLVLIGEKGVGKRRFARAIHGRSPRCRELFITIESRSIESSDLVKLLSGWAGTPGTLYLDGLHGISSDCLKILLEHVYRYESSRLSRPRLIAGIREAVLEKNSVPPSLYYRLGELELRLPPLREISEEVPRILADWLIHRSASAFRLNQEEQNLLRQYVWPGNASELSHFGKLLLDGGDRSRVFEMLRQKIRRQQRPIGLRGKIAEIERCVERRLIAQAMLESDGNVRRASHRLGLQEMDLLGRIEALQVSTGQPALPPLILQTEC